MALHDAPNVLTLKTEPSSEFQLSRNGKNLYLLCRNLHHAALKSFYGKAIPKAQAAVQNDGTLCLFWRCGGFPIVIRIDSGYWRRRP